MNTVIKPIPSIPAAAPTRQKWEYLNVTVVGKQVHEVNYEKLTIIDERGKIKPRIISIAEFANLLGDQGWELTAAFGETMALGTRTWLFKRPKA